MILKAQIPQGNYYFYDSSNSDSHFINTFFHVPGVKRSWNDPIVSWAAWEMPGNKEVFKYVLLMGYYLNVQGIIVPEAMGQVIQRHYPWLPFTFIASPEHPIGIYEDVGNARRYIFERGEILRCFDSYHDLDEWRFFQFKLVANEFDWTVLGDFQDNTEADDEETESKEYNLAIAQYAAEYIDPPQRHSGKYWKSRRKVA